MTLAVKEFANGVSISGGPDHHSGVRATRQPSLSDAARSGSGGLGLIDGWYNAHRRHAALGYLSTAEFERRKTAAPLNGILIAAIIRNQSSHAKSNISGQLRGSEQSDYRAKKQFVASPQLAARYSNSLD